jgi:hypothetical protein
MTNCRAPSASLHAIGMPTLSVGPTNYVQKPSRIPQNLQCALTTLLSRSTLALSACTITVDLASPAPRGPTAVPPSTDSTSFERP